MATAAPAPAMPAEPQRTARSARAQHESAYRADIDGLRALAVLPVLLFHSGIPGVGGGYVGVDVFFVISGYLITGIIQREVSEGRFSIVRFYERRVRRLFPAMSVVVLLTTLCASWLLWPGLFRDYAQSLAAVVLFSSNVLFYLESGYFDSPAEVKPLLHTWSLSVEEQFYLLIPPLLLLVHHYLGRKPVRALAVLSLLSFAANIVYVDRDRSADFYLLPFRAWELGIGSLLALGALPAVRGARLAGALGATGIALVLVAVVTFSAQTPFPGWAALVPCVGTALILHSGALGRGFAVSVLSLPPVVFIGKTSYSIYLWHWPLIVFAKYLDADSELHPPVAALVIVGSLVLGALSWRFVEQPFRDPRTAPGRGRLFAFAGLMSAAFLVVGVAGDRTDGLPQRLPLEARRFAQAADDFWPGPKQAEPWPAEPRWVRKFGDASATPHVLMWGDSHANIVVHALDPYAAQPGHSALLAALDGCPPLVGIAKAESHTAAAENAQCSERNARVVALLGAHPEIERVLLVSRWAYFAQGGGYGQRERTVVELWPSGGRPDHARTREVFERALERTLQTLTGLGKQVFVLEQVPELAGYSTSLARSYVLRGQTQALDQRMRVARAEVERRQAAFTGVLARWASDPRVHVLRTRDFFCDARVCPGLRAGQPRYFDNNHVTTSVAVSMAPLFAPALR